MMTLQPVRSQVLPALLSFQSSGCPLLGAAGRCWHTLSRWRRQQRLSQPNECAGADGFHGGRMPAGISAPRESPPRVVQRIHRNIRTLRIQRRSRLTILSMVCGISKRRVGSGRTAGLCATSPERHPRTHFPPASWNSLGICCDGSNARDSSRRVHSQRKRSSPAPGALIPEDVTTREAAHLPF